MHCVFVGTAHRRIVTHDQHPGDANCDTCDAGSGECLTCDAGYGAVPNKVMRGSGSTFACDACTGNTYSIGGIDTCDACLYHILFMLSLDHHLAGPVGCATCDNETGTCLTCSAGYGATPNKGSGSTCGFSCTACIGSTYSLGGTSMCDACLSRDMNVAVLSSPLLQALWAVLRARRTPVTA